MMYLIIARHGDYDIETGSLNKGGEAHSRGLAEKIKGILPAGGLVRILVSPKPRATQTARIIGVHVGVSYEIHEVLFSDDDYPCKSTEIYNLVSEKSDVDVLVLVTHFEVTDEFPMVYGANEGWNRPLGYGSVHRGQAWLLDCETQTKKLL
jgi:phosphohistidine phosphatase SixA